MITQNTSDPLRASSRIFVRGFKTMEQEPGIKESLIQVFTRFGAIDGITMVLGGAFVQYFKEASAIEAIKQENGATFMDKKLSIYLLLFFN